MKKYINPKYFYLLLPFTIFFVAFFVSLNYILNNNLKSFVLCIMKTFVFVTVVNIFIPLILEIITGYWLLDTVYFLIYFYLLSTVFGIYLIKEQSTCFSQ